eukprot:1160765-Pelagomonas_calceolata.AAC.10
MLTANRTRVLRFPELQVGKGLTRGPSDLNKTQPTLGNARNKAKGDLDGRWLMSWTLGFSFSYSLLPHAHHPPTPERPLNEEHVWASVKTHRFNCAVPVR